MERFLPDINIHRGNYWILINGLIGASEVLKHKKKKKKIIINVSISMWKMICISDNMIQSLFIDFFSESWHKSLNLLIKNNTGGPRLVQILGPGKNRTSEIRTSRY